MTIVIASGEALWQSRGKLHSSGLLRHFTPRHDILMKRHKIDATNKILGRLAVKIANLLRGKEKTNFVPYLDMGDEVIVFNTDRIKVTGKKLKQKLYWRHTGYPGGIKKQTLGELMKKDSREVVRKAVYGMLPKNKLRDRMIKRLKLYRGEKE